MALLSPSEQKEIISELESLAQLLGLDVVESVKFPTITGQSHYAFQVERKP